MKTRVLRQREWTICALETGPSCPAEDYIKSLQEQDKKKVLRLLEFAAENGPPINRQKFHKVQGDIYEFKSSQDRLLCFFQPNRVIVLTHGLRKKQDRLDKTEIERAERLREEFLGG